MSKVLELLAMGAFFFAFFFTIGMFGIGAW